MTGEVSLTSGTIVVEDFRLGGGGRLKTSGPTTLVIRGKLELSGSINLEGKPSHLTVLLADGAQATVNGGAKASMVLYGPEAKIRITDGSTLYGAIVGNNVEVLGGCHLHFDERLLDGGSSEHPNGGSESQILNWQKF